MNRNYSLSVAALIFFINGACVAQSASPQLPAGMWCQYCKPEEAVVGSVRTLL
jgi:hypothetical protein